MVGLIATTPAARFGMAAKGALVVGGADTVVFDPTSTRTLHASDLHHTSDYTPYEGRVVRGAVRDVIQRSRDVVRGGVFVGQRGAGRYLGRGRIDG